ncbi:MAG: quinol:cytochrome C oxidoreductase [Phycisphaerales bacterium]
MAHSHRHTIDITREPRMLGDLGAKLFIPAIIIGLVGLGVTLAMAWFGEPELRSRALQGYLVSFMFFLAIGLGSLFFVLIHHLTRAGWSVTVRRIAEGLATNLAWMAVLFLPLLWGLFDPSIEIFPWADPHRLDHNSSHFDALVAHKAAYLNTTFFIIRAAIYFAVWAFLSRYFFNLSVRQDETGDVELSHRMAAISAPGMILFALTLTFAAFDWLMSQDPHWFSTIFGVYYFATAVTSFLAATIIACVFLQRAGRLPNAITTEHFHDLGKLMFAFGAVFWAYIAYSQYMLQWYGNLPEETNWWQPRASTLLATISGHSGEFQPGAWNYWTTALLLLHFCIPFVALVSRVPKRRPMVLMVLAFWMLAVCWFDIFWLVMPVFHPSHASLELTDFLSLIGFAGVFIGLLAGRMRNVALVPEKDPRLEESLAFENL